MIHINSQWNLDIDKHTDWGGDSSTNGLPVSGREILEFIKKSLLKKIGYVAVINSTNYGFADLEDYERYLSDEDDSLVIDTWPVVNVPFIRATRNIYKWSENIPSKPTSQNPNGWSYNETSPENLDLKLWMCWGTFVNNELDENGWLGPNQVMGTNKDGKTQYIHIKYSNDGGLTFTENLGETSGDYIGIYADFELEDSTDPAVYKWTKIKGESGGEGVKGPQGDDGKPLVIRLSENSLVLIEDLTLESGYKNLPKTITFSGKFGSEDVDFNTPTIVDNTTNLVVTSSKGKITISNTSGQEIQDGLITGTVKASYGEEEITWEFSLPVLLTELRGWKENIVEDTKIAVATSIGISDGNGGNESLQNIGTFIQSSREMTSQILSTMGNGQNFSSFISQTANNIKQEVSDDLGSVGVNIEGQDKSIILQANKVKFVGSDYTPADDDYYTPKVGIKADGTIWAENADLSGKIVASSGNIGNWDISENGLSTTNRLSYNRNSTISLKSGLESRFWTGNNSWDNPEPNTWLYSIDLNSTGLISWRGKYIPFEVAQDDDVSFAEGVIIDPERGFGIFGIGASHSHPDEYINEIYEDELSYSTLFRSDGSGFLAGGNFSWNSNGTISLTNSFVSSIYNALALGSSKLVGVGVNQHTESIKLSQEGLELYSSNSSKTTVKFTGVTIEDSEHNSTTIIPGEINLLGEDNGFTLVSSLGVQTSGTVVASELKVSGGTSSQFLKADGSLDNNTYYTKDQVKALIINAINTVLTTVHSGNYTMVGGLVDEFELLVPAPEEVVPDDGLEDANEGTPE